MSFGWSAGDIAALVKLAYTVTSNCKKACGEYDELTRQVDSLYCVLKRLAVEQARPESLLSRDVDTVWDDLGPSVRGSKDVLISLNGIVKKYAGINRRDTRLGRFWQRAKFGNKELSEVNDLRQRARFYTQSISTIIDTVAVGSLGRIEQQIDDAGLKDLKPAIENLAKKLARTTGGGGSVFTAYTNDETRVWRDLRRELVKAGVAPSDVIRKNKDLIKDFIQDLGSQGVLDEEADGSGDDSGDDDQPASFNAEDGRGAASNSAKTSRTTYTPSRPLKSSTRPGFELTGDADARTQPREVSGRGRKYGGQAHSSSSKSGLTAAEATSRRKRSAQSNRSPSDQTREEDDPINKPEWKPQTYTIDTSDDERSSPARPRNKNNAEEEASNRRRVRFVDPSDDDSVDVRGGFGARPLFSKETYWSDSDSFDIVSSDHESSSDGWDNTPPRASIRLKSPPRVSAQLTSQALVMQYLPDVPELLRNTFARRRRFYYLGDGVRISWWHMATPWGFCLMYGNLNVTELLEEMKLLTRLIQDCLHASTLPSRRMRTRLNGETGHDPLEHRSTLERQERALRLWNLRCVREGRQEKDIYFDFQSIDDDSMMEFEEETVNLSSKFWEDCADIVCHLLVKDSFDEDAKEPQLHAPADATSEGADEQGTTSERSSSFAQTPLGKLNTIMKIYREKHSRLATRCLTTEYSFAMERNQAHRKVSELILTEILMEIDGLEGGDENFRAARRDAVQKVQRTLDELEAVMHRSRQNWER